MMPSSSAKVNATELPLIVFSIQNEHARNVEWDFTKIDVMHKIRK